MAERCETGEVCRFEQHTEQWWVDEVSAMRWLPPGDRPLWRLEGTCPRCGDIMWAETGPAIVGENIVPPPIFVRCNCSSDHPGRDAEHKDGCGQHARVDLWKA